MNDSVLLCRNFYNANEYSSIPTFLLFISNQNSNWIVWPSRVFFKRFKTKNLKSNFEPINLLNWRYYCPLGFGFIFTKYLPRFLQILDSHGLRFICECGVSHEQSIMNEDHELNEEREREDSFYDAVKNVCYFQRPTQLARHLSLITSRFPIVLTKQSLFCTIPADALDLLYHPELIAIRKGKQVFRRETE